MRGGYNGVGSCEDGALLALRYSAFTCCSPPPSSAFLQGLVLEILVEYYSQDHAHIARVLDICLELQV